MGESSDVENLAEICGAFIGDGWIESRGGSCYLTGHKTEDKEYYDEHMASIFKENLIEVVPKNYPYWRVYGIGVHKKAVIKKLLEIGIPNGKKVYSAEIPRWIMESDMKIKTAFLRGLFDTDGNFHCKKCYGRYDNYFRKKYHCQPRIMIASVSELLMKQSFEMLNQVGLHPEKIKMRVGGIKKGINHKKNYFIKLNILSEIIRWFEVLKLSANPKHIKKYLIWKKFGFVPPKTSIEERRNILKGELDIYSYYAGVPERPNGIRSRVDSLLEKRIFKQEKTT